MPDLATPNLPSRDFAATEAFYSDLGFETGYKGAGWLILHRGERGNRVILEFFAHKELEPAQSWFSACIRMDDPSDFLAEIESSAVPIEGETIPRFHPPKVEPSGLSIAYLIDIDGSLIRIIEND